MGERREDALAALFVEPLLLISPSGVIRSCNRAARDLCGVQDGEPVGAAIDGADVHSLLETCSEKLPPVTARLTVRTAAGPQVVRGRAVVTEYAAEPVIALTLDLGGGPHAVDGQQAAADQLRAHLEQLQRLTLSLADALDADEVMRETVRVTQRLLGADSSTLWLLRSADGQLDLARQIGGSDELLRPVSPIPHDRQGPISEALARQDVVVLRNREDLLTRFPAATEAPAMHETYIVAPLRAAQTDVGVLVVGFGHETDVTEQQLAFVRAATAQCAHALYRAQVHDDLQQQHQRSAFRAEAGRLLASSLDYDRTLRHITDLAGPAIADACAVALTAPDGQLHLTAATHRDPGYQVVLDQLIARYHTVRNPYVLKVLGTGEPLVLDWITPSHLDQMQQDEEHRRLLDSLGATSAIAVPLECMSERKGVLLVISTSDPPQLGPGDLPFVQSLADHAALAIANADAHRRAEELATQLDQALTSRVIIEQAKGVLAERHGEDPDTAFRRLHREARSTHQRIHDLARDVIAGHVRL